MDLACRRFVVFALALLCWLPVDLGAQQLPSGTSCNASAVAVVRLLAELGDAECQGYFGALLVEGLDVPKDYAEALRWSRLSAEQGNGTGQAGLGRMYAEGLGVPQDYPEAVRWFRLSAEQGNAWGQAGLGRMYAEGRGVPQDYVQAYMWYNLSAVQGFELAVESRNGIAAKMTSAQIAEGQRLTRGWKPVSER